MIAVKRSESGGPRCYGYDYLAPIASFTVELRTVLQLHCYTFDYRRNALGVTVNIRMVATALDTVITSSDLFHYPRLITINACN